MNDYTMAFQESKFLENMKKPEIIAMTFASGDDYFYKKFNRGNEYIIRSQKSVFSSDFEKDIQKNLINIFDSIQT